LRTLTRTLKDEIAILGGLKYQNHSGTETVKPRLINYNFNQLLLEVSEFLPFSHLDVVQALFVEVKGALGASRSHCALSAIKQTGHNWSQLVTAITV